MKIAYQLTTEELTEIEKAIKQDKRPEVRQRATAIRLLHLKYRPETVAEQQMVSLPTIYNWHKLWREKGIEGLANRPKPGRVPKADAAYCQKLEEALEKEPSDYGYSFTIWTTDRLRQHLEKETGLLLSNSRFRALMKKKGYRYRRPKYDLSHLQNTEAKEEAEKVLEELKKRASKTISGFSLWTK
jgi:transposase